LLRSYDTSTEGLVVLIALVLYLARGKHYE